MIRVICPGCGKQFNAKDKYAGRKTKCRACKAVLRIEGKRFEPPPPPPPPPEVKPPAPPPEAKAPPPPEVENPPEPVATESADSVDQPIEKPFPFANASLACGAGGLVVPGVNVAAIVLGVVALGRDEDDATRQKTQPRAYGGIALGVLGLLFHLLALIIAIGMASWQNRSATQQTAVATPTAPPPAPVVQAEPPPPAPVVVPAPLATPAATPPKNQVWFYDLNTGQLFVGKKEEQAPVDAPSGPLPDGSLAGVRAWVFSCGDCSDPKQRFVGWYDRLLPAAKAFETDPNAQVDVDQLIEHLQAQVEVSTDATNWQKMHLFIYGMKWQLEKRKTLCTGGGFATECHP